MTLAMYIKVIRYAFFGKLKEELNKVREVPIFMKLSMATLAIICLVGGILLFAGISDVFLKQAQAVLLVGTKYAFTVLGEVIK